MQGLGQLLLAQLVRVRASPIARRFATLLGWSSAATLFDRAAFALAVYVCAHLIDGTDFGRWGMAQSTIMAIQIYVLVGGGMLISRFLPAFRENSPEEAVGVVRMTLAVSAIALLTATVGIFVLSDRIALEIFRAPSTPLLPTLLVLWLGLTALSGILQTVVTSFEDGRILALSSALAGVIALIVLPVAALRFGYQGMIGGMIFVESTRCAVLWRHSQSLFLRTGYRLLGRVSGKVWKLFYSFGIPVFLQSMLYAPTIWATQLIIVQRNSGGLLEVGAFNFAMIFFSIVLMAAMQVNRASLPILSELAATNQNRSLARVASRMMLVQLLSAVLIAAPIALLSPLIMTDAFKDHWLVLCLVAAAGVAVSLQNSLSNTLLVVDRQVTVFWTIVPWAGLMLGIAWFQFELGALALALALLVSGIVRTAILAVVWIDWRSKSEMTNP